MKRFLSTTAIVLTMSGAATGAAFAEAHTEGFGNVAVEETDFLASDLIGMRIYNSEAEMEADATIEADAEKEWDDIGEINDIIVSQEGDVTAVILGVGGFLGMGERDVSISMDKIKILTDEDGDRFLVVTTSKEMLEQSPEFERPMVEGMDKVENDEAKPMMTETETETEETAENVEAETEEMAQETEAETEEMAAEVEAETEEMANEVEAESEEMEQEAEVMAEEAEENTEAAVESEPVESENTTVITGDETVERDLLPRPEVEREGYEAAGAEMIGQMSAEDLEGTPVYGADDETVGEIDTLLIADDGKIDRVVINVGGFLGLGEKPVAVTFDELQILKNVEGDDVRIYIDSTEERLESQPEYEEK